jgi:hypothetical protein
MKFELRPYQTKLPLKAVDTLKNLNSVYLAMAVRTGKTLTALETCSLFGAKKVLFLTKKRAIDSIIKDHTDFGYKFELVVINDESMHKLDKDFDPDVVIHDEHHRFGAFPKPGQAAKLYRELYYNKPQIFLSGTPTPESYSQIFHQFWVTSGGPWKQYASFYKWANDYVDKKQRRLPTHVVIDYTRADKVRIMKEIEPYMITFTQEQAGFTTKIDEEILYVDMKPITVKMCDRLISDLVIEGKEELILADTPAKLKQKIHQLCSGTIKFESGNRMVIDDSKAVFMKERFAGKKLAIFYKFVAELDCIKQVMGDLVTTDINEFKSDPSKSYAVQIVSGREGTSYAEADYLIMFNIDFSATSYWQGRDRLTTIGRIENKMFWLMMKGGIEDKIYQSVCKKKTYTVSHFKRDYKIKS